MQSETRQGAELWNQNRQIILHYLYGFAHSSLAIWFSKIKVNYIDIELNIKLPIETTLVSVLLGLYFYNLFPCYPL